MQSSKQIQQVSNCCIEAADGAEVRTLHLTVLIATGRQVFTRVLKDDSSRALQLLAVGMTLDWLSWLCLVIVLHKCSVYMAGSEQAAATLQTDNMEQPSTRTKRQCLGQSCVPEAAAVCTFAVAIALQSMYIAHVLMLAAPTFARCYRPVLSARQPALLA